MIIIPLLAEATGLTIKDETDITLAVSTFILAVFTALMACFTCWLAKSTKRLADEAKEASIRQIGVQTWLEMSKRFNADELLTQRIELAWYLAGNRTSVSPQNYNLSSDAVLVFFEDIGTLISLGHIDKQLSEDTFGYYSRRWWKILEDYIFDLRKKRENPTLYINFERYVKGSITKPLLTRKNVYPF